MSAATYPGQTKVVEGRDRGTLYGLIAANQKIPAGAYVAIIGGFWINVTSTTGLEGRIAQCLKDVDNTGGANGAKRIELRMLGGRKLEVVKNDVGGSPFTATDIGEEFYWLDNQTVTLSNGLLASLIARITDLRTQILAHAAGTGTYHGTADGASYTITVPTNAAEVYTACGQLKTTGLAHVVKVSGSPAIHGVVDTAAQGALSALVIPSTPEEARLFVEAFAAIMFGTSGHTNRTAPAVHGAVDAANVLTSSASSITRSKGGRVWGFVTPTFTSPNANSDLFVEVY
jgi:hypothetical protein